MAVAETSDFDLSVASYLTQASWILDGICGEIPLVCRTESVEYAN